MDACLVGGKLVMHLLLVWGYLRAVGGWGGLFWAIRLGGVLSVSGDFLCFSVLCGVDII